LRSFNSPPPTIRLWYTTQRWKNRSRLQLIAEPLCRFCANHGISRRAKVADHIIPHGGDWNSFLTGELQSLCKPCHDGIKTKVERQEAKFEAQGYRPDIGEDGLPIDKNHPAYSRELKPPPDQPSTAKPKPWRLPEI
jgi:5-methylcytosine-specific restriction enzyme A